MNMQPFVSRRCQRFAISLLLLPILLVLTACASKPLNPWTTDSPPLALVPVADTGVDDQRGRFREIYCEVLESRGEDWPDYRPCDEASRDERKLDFHKPRRILPRKGTLPL